MRTIHCLFLSLLAAIVLRAEQDVPRSREAMPKYGSKGSGMIEVAIAGDSLEKPGIYYLPAGTMLYDLIKRARPNDVSPGRFTVFRDVDGYERTFGFQMSKTKEPPIPDFPLCDADMVYAATRLHQQSAGKK